MAVQVRKIVQGNTAPSYNITCERSGTAIDVTGCTITLILARGNTITNAGANCTIVTAASGIVNFQPITTDFPLPGSYKADIKLTYSNGTVEILYEQAKWKVRSKIA